MKLKMKLNIYFSEIDALRKANKLNRKFEAMTHPYYSVRQMTLKECNRVVFAVVKVEKPGNGVNYILT